MERAPDACPVCGRGKPLNAIGIPVACCSRIPPLPVRADEHRSFRRVVCEWLDRLLLATTDCARPLPLLAGFIVIVIAGALVLLAVVLAT